MTSLHGDPLEITRYWLKLNLSMLANFNFNENQWNIFGKLYFYNLKKLRKKSIFLNGNCNFRNKKMFLNKLENKINLPFISICKIIFKIFKICNYSGIIDKKKHQNCILQECEGNVFCHKFEFCIPISLYPDIWYFKLRLFYLRKCIVSKYRSKT